MLLSSRYLTPSLANSLITSLVIWLRNSIFNIMKIMLIKLVMFPFANKRASYFLLWNTCDFFRPYVFFGALHLWKYYPLRAPSVPSVILKGVRTDKNSLAWIRTPLKQGRHNNPFHSCCTLLQVEQTACKPFYRRKEEDTTPLSVPCFDHTTVLLDSFIIWSEQSAILVLQFWYIKNQRRNRRVW